MADLVRHVGEVYLDKVECMRLGHQPESWPPPGLQDEPPLQLLDRGYADLTGQFAARRPQDHTFTWYKLDQSVAFWIRRIAQETVIHRVNAELGARAQVTGIPGVTWPPTGSMSCWSPSCSTARPTGPRNSPNCSSPATGWSAW